ncbi:hypothetical protein EVAR_75715_1 [Eumeta japonica]|uniref:Uncharacterized protein n=1 Tax=Eumeta variegata TaxID=151549 RepID=A0A4C1W003_EUMVA|nr:hypothetical protein EVAR_75715_1 [Eumeta japonica]
MIIPLNIAFEAQMDMSPPALNHEGVPTSLVSTSTSEERIESGPPKTRARCADHHLCYNVIPGARRGRCSLLTCHRDTSIQICACAASSLNSAISTRKAVLFYLA